MYLFNLWPQKPQTNGIDSLWFFRYIFLWSHVRKHTYSKHTTWHIYPANKPPPLHIYYSRKYPLPLCSHSFLFLTLKQVIYSVNQVLIFWSMLLLSWFLICCKPNNDTLHLCYRSFWQWVLSLFYLVVIMWVNSLKGHLVVSFHMSIGHLYVFFGKMHIQVFCPFLNHVFFFLTSSCSSFIF